MLELVECVLFDCICDVYYFLVWCLIVDYKAFVEDVGLVDIEIEDWSEEVKLFWKGVIKIVLMFKGVIGLFKFGVVILCGVLVMLLM